MTITKAIYPGTFDPPTLGHLDVINRCVSFCDQLYIGIGTNPSKRHPTFSPQERESLLNRIFNHNPKIRVSIFDGLLVDFVEEHSIDIIIRAFRTSTDVSYELAQASLNRQMTGIETFWISSMPQYRDISSTLIKEMGRGRKPLSHFIPPEIVQDVEDRLFNR